MDSPSFDISFSLDFWTRYHASRAIIHRLWSTWFAYAFFVGVPTLCLIAALLLHWDLSRPGAFGLPGWAALLGGYLFMFVFMPLLHMFQLWSASRRNRTLLGVQHQALTPEGFSTSGEAFNTNLKWDAILKAIETKHFFFLYISSRAAYFIPKAQIPSASEQERLRHVIKTYLHDKAQLSA